MHCNQKEWFSIALAQQQWFNSPESRPKPRRCSKWNLVQQATNSIRWRLCKGSTVQWRRECWTQPIPQWCPCPHRLWQWTHPVWLWTVQVHSIRQPWRLHRRHRPTDPAVASTLPEMAKSNDRKPQPNSRTCSKQWQCERWPAREREPSGQKCLGETQGKRVACKWCCSSPAVEWWWAAWSVEWVWLV